VCFDLVRLNELKGKIGGVNLKVNITRVLRGFRGIIGVLEIWAVFESGGMIYSREVTLAT
jgi:hypothetical protein